MHIDLQVTIFPSMSDRRYSDEEVAAIFRVAAERSPAALQPAANQDGLTLADLQSIGSEVGISPVAVAQAAIALDVHGGSAQRKFLGIPVGVSRTVDLNRRLTDDEWERVVVQLRDVFDAAGRTRDEGSLRRWWNGNLNVLLEPTETGHRLRFRTFNSGAQASLTIGLVALGTAAATTLAVGINGNLAGASTGIAFLGIVGVGMIASGALRLRGWVRLRGRQMESVAAQFALPVGATEKQLPASPE